jgi:hypothetical protein
MAGGINGNQGAESLLSFMLSLLSVIESYAIIDKIQAGQNSLTELTCAFDAIALDSEDGESIADEEDTTESQISQSG